MTLDWTRRSLFGLVVCAAALSGCSGSSESSPSTTSGSDRVTVDPCYVQEVSFQGRM